MQIFRCCFLGDVTGRSAGHELPERAVGSLAPFSNDLGTSAVAFEDQGFAPARSSDRGAEEADAACQSATTHCTIAVDATFVDAPCVPPHARWSEFGTRPELEAFFLQSPIVANKNKQGSFSKEEAQPDSVNLDSINSLGGHSSGALPLFPSACQPQRELRCTTFAQLMCAMSSSSWVGQGAQGAVVKAQWWTGCTVAVKWLVTDAISIPAAYMEALVAKMLAHPFLVQTFECSMCQLDDSFEQPSVRTVGYSPWASQIARKEGVTTQLNVEPLSVDAVLDSFEGPHPHLGPRPVDCVEVLKQLGAAPGKYVVQIVSEWCDEGTLHAAIRNGVFRPTGKRSKTWALRALLRTATEIAQGMCHLHSLNIIHGDLKPGNVLLKSSRVDSRGFVAKVADFGLSRLCGQHDAYVKTAEWGTVPYMAGEYLDNKLCKSSDVYSFGVLLWQMYTGKAPFEGHHEAQVAVGVMMGSLQLEWPTSMPPPLLRLGQACCRHEPQQRPSFKECVVALVGLEAQIRQMAARLKARNAQLAALQRYAASHGPCAKPLVPRDSLGSVAAAGGDVGGGYGQAAAAGPFAGSSPLVPQPASMRCSSLEAQVGAAATAGCASGASMDGCIQMHCGCYVPSYGGLPQLHLHEGEEGEAAYSVWQSQRSQGQPEDAGDMAANGACAAALALAALPDCAVSSSGLPSASTSAPALTRTPSGCGRVLPATAASAAGWGSIAGPGPGPGFHPALGAGEFWCSPTGGCAVAGLGQAPAPSAGPCLAAAAQRRSASSGATTGLEAASASATASVSAGSHRAVLVASSAPQPGSFGYACACACGGAVRGPSAAVDPNPSLSGGRSAERGSYNNSQHTVLYVCASYGGASPYGPCFSRPSPASSSSAGCASGCGSTPRTGCSVGPLMPGRDTATTNTTNTITTNATASATTASTNASSSSRNAAFSYSSWGNFTPCACGRGMAATAPYSALLPMSNSEGHAPAAAAAACRVHFTPQPQQQQHCMVAALEGAGCACGPCGGGPQTTNATTAAAYGSGIWAVARGQQGPQGLLGQHSAAVTTAAPSPQQARAMSARRGSTGRMLQHVPEDEVPSGGLGPEGGGFSAAAALDTRGQLLCGPAAEGQASNP